MHSHFWTWSLETYEHGSVSQKLIQLQDQFDLNVNILLWCIWTANHFDQMPEFALRKAIESTQTWNNDVTASIRKARRFIKSDPTDCGELTKALKEAELLSEHIEQEKLHRIAQKYLTQRQVIDPISQARNHLIQYLTLTGTPRKTGFSVGLIEALLHDIFDNNNDT